MSVRKIVDVQPGSRTVISSISKLGMKSRAITNVRFLISALKWWLGHVETFREVLVKHGGLGKIFGYSSAISY